MNKGFDLHWMESLLARLWKQSEVWNNPDIIGSYIWINQASLLVKMSLQAAGPIILFKFSLN